MRCKFAVAGRGEKRLLKGVVAEEKSGSALCKYILATKAQQNTTISLPESFHPCPNLQSFSSNSRFFSGLLVKSAALLVK